MNALHAAPFHLAHRVDTSKIAQFLVHLLDCDYWYVVCHSEHQLVLHLSREHTDRYAVSFDCTPPVDKAVYHGSMSSQFSIIALRDQSELPDAKLEEIRTALGRF